MGERHRANGFDAWTRSIISLCVFSCISFSAARAQIGDPSQDQEGRMLLAEAWAPILFQDMSTHGRSGTQQIEPSDALVDLFFNDPESIRDNGEAIYRVSHRDWARVFQGPPVYFSVSESQTHFYIEYFGYHAADTNAEGHMNDTENIFAIVKKDGSTFGTLEGVVTNAHGRPMIYGLNEKIKAAARRVDTRSLDRRAMRFLDRNSLEHHEASDVEFVRRRESKSFKAFVAASSHAIYKFSSKGSVENSVIYYPSACKECFEDIKGYRNTLIGYNLVDFDVVFDETVNSKALSEHFDSIFTRVDSDLARVSSQYEARNLPNYLASGWDESEPAANLFFVTSFKTRFTLADPAAVHDSLVGGSDEISSDYIYNYYLDLVDSEVVRAEPPMFFKRASVWGIASRLFRAVN